VEQQPKVRQGEVFFADPDQLMGWVKDPNVDERLVLQVMPGPADERAPLLQGFMGVASLTSMRGLFLGSNKVWIEKGVLSSLHTLLERARMPQTQWVVLQRPPESWEMLWALIDVEGFAVEEPLRDMVDRNFYLVHDAHRLLWEARWIARENSDPQVVADFVALFVRWIKGEALSDADQAVLAGLQVKRQVTTDVQKLDLVNFLFALARQNGLLDRVIFVIDNIELALKADKRQLLKQFYEFVDSVRRWIAIGGTPIGILIGFSSTSEDRAVLRKYQPKLAAEVEAGLHWCRRLLS
jgi:hypothetical protein